MSTLFHADDRFEVHKVVVGPVDNNVYVLRCTETGDAVLLDAANEHDRLLDLCRALDVRSVLETHGHWDHIQAVPQLRDAGYEVHVTAEDADMLPSYDQILDDDSVVQVGRVRLRTIHTPGHTPGSMCFLVEGSPVLFSGDTLFPGGPGNTKFPGATSPRSSTRSRTSSSRSRPRPASSPGTATRRPSAPSARRSRSGSTGAGERPRRAGR